MEKDITIERITLRRTDNTGVNMNSVRRLTLDTIKGIQRLMRELEDIPRSRALKTCYRFHARTGTILYLARDLHKSDLIHGLLAFKRVSLIRHDESFGEHQGFIEELIVQEKSRNFSIGSHLVERVLSDMRQLNSALETDREKRLEKLRISLPAPTVKNDFGNTFILLMGFELEEIITLNGVTEHVYGLSVTPAVLTQKIQP